MADNLEGEEPQQHGSHEESEETILLRELCIVNGINFEKLLHGAGMKVKTLEIFFFGCPKIIGLCHFPNLRCLQVVNQKISSMAGVGCCKTLEELWICEGEIEVIDGLEELSNLTHLCLYCNKIKAITGLSQLVKLEKLWLNRNRIRRIEGVSNLTRLKDLNLADNLISSIRDYLAHMKELESLNLSGNPISSLEELFNVYCLSSLKFLSLCDPLYPPSPVCRLCNYSSLVLYHMPGLVTLDGRNVDSKDLQELIRNLVSKKKQFYRLKIHAHQQKSLQEKKGIKRRIEERRGITYSRLRALHHHLKALNEVSNEKMDDALLQKTNMVTKRIKTLEETMDQTIAECEREEGAGSEREAWLKRRWCRELESGGNLRYIPGKEDQGWYKSCSELVSSRFIASDFTSYGITGVHVAMVTRIEDRTLYYRFSDRVKSLTEETQAQPKKKIKELFDYLFLVKGPDEDSLDFECGGSSLTEEEAPPLVLTNSISMAEDERLKKAGPFDKRRGELLLCKVYVGDLTEHKGRNSPKSSQYPRTSCVYSNVSSSPQSSDLMSQRLYHVFDHRLVLPEYCITVDYTMEHPMGTVEWEGQVGGENADDELIGMDPQPETRPKLSMLDSNTLVSLAQEDALECIKELDLSCNRLSRFRFSSALPLLSSLSLSFNELETTEDFNAMLNLQTLDISFNKITSLQGMKSLPKLTVLDVSWNFLHDQYSDVGTLKKQVNNLQSLDIRHNKWQKVDTVHLMGMLRSLQYLNGELVSEQQTTSALRQVVSTHLSLSSLLPHCRVDPTPPPVLSLSPIAKQIITNSSPFQPGSSSSSCNGAAAGEVTTADLSSLKLQKLSCLDKLTNLKWVCLQDNLLTTTEGIERCSQLEELTLDDNLLVTPPSLHNHSQLKWLSLGNNNLSALPSPAPSSSHSCLTYLNISGNNVSSLSGIEHFPSLQELYASHNPIDILRQLLALKPLTHLLIADFSHTPVSSLSSYRLFAVFHLSSLKCLDTKVVSNSEVALAKDKLGGRLTQDSVYEKSPSTSFSSIKTLDFPNSGLKHVDLSPVNSFDNLLSLNLEQNSLTTFSGIIHLKKLKVLCLNHNRIECLIKQVGGADPDSTPILPSLQVLHLAYNGISQLLPLQLNSLISLRALFLQGNEISRVEGLNGLYRLTELVLDRNKIKMMNEHSLEDLTQLRELHIEENRLSDLSNLHCVQNLERLYLGMNRIQDYSELEKLGGLNSLVELSIISNPISRRMQHRSLLVFKLSSLQSLDGVAVSGEERQTAEMTFSDRHEDSLEQQQQVLPSLNGTGQVKVTSMPFHISHTSKRHQSQTVEMRNVHMQTLQSFHEKRRGMRR